MFQNISEQIIAEKNELATHYIQQNRLEEQIKNEPVDAKKNIENEDLRNKTDLGYHPLRFDYHWTRQVRYTFFRG